MGLLASYITVLRRNEREWIKGQTQSFLACIELCTNEYLNRRKRSGYNFEMLCTSQSSLCCKGAVADKRKGIWVKSRKNKWRYDQKCCPSLSECNC